MPDPLRFLDGPGGAHAKGLDSKGEFLAAISAGPVYHLLRKRGVDTDQMPAAEEPILNIGYYKHAGGHGTIPSDWEVFLKFMELHLAPGQ